MEPKAKNKKWMGAFLVLGILFVYLLLWWNRSFGVSSEGWFKVFAENLAAGKWPYRDFYLFAPPGHLFEIYLLQETGFSNYADIRLIGVFQRLLLSLVLYWWFARFTSPSHAALAVITMVLAYSGDGADTLFYLNHSSMLYAVAATWLCSLWLDKPKVLFLVLMAALSSFSFWCKQTLGLGVSFFLLVVVTMNMFGKKGAGHKKDPVFFLAVWFGIALAVVVTLQRHGALQPFFQQVFGAGSSSKGGLADILFRPFSLIFVPLSLLVFAWLWSRSADNRLSEEQYPASKEMGSFLRVILGAAAGLGLGIAAALAWPSSLNADAFSVAQIFLVLAGGGACFWLVARLSYALRTRPLELFRSQEFLLAGFGLTTWFFLAVSYPLYELMAIPSVGIAVLLFRPWWISKRAAANKPLARNRLYALWTCAIALMVAGKLLTPFSFYEIKDAPVLGLRGQNDSLLLRGMDLSEETTKGLGTILNYLEPCRGSHGEVFVFPHMPALYSLSDTLPATFAMLHWIDVTPDYIVRQDIETLEKKPPSMVILMPFQDDEITYLEKLYRGGKQSEFRHMAHFLDNLVRENYELKAEVSMGNNSRPVQVWAKK